MATIDRNNARLDHTGHRADTDELTARDNIVERVRRESCVHHALEIRVNDHVMGVTTCTLDHVDELAAGFLVARGIVSDADDVLHVDVDRQNAQQIANVVLDPDVHCDHTRLTRHVLTRTSDGLTGQQDLESSQRVKPIRASRFAIQASKLCAMSRRLPASQQGFHQGQVLCAAGVFDHEGRTILVRDEIARQNAIDKVLGYGLFNDLLPFDRHVLVIAGRASYDVVQKAIAGGFAMVLASDEPSRLARRLAREAGQTLVVHGPGAQLRIYTHPHRVQQQCPTRRGD